MSKAAFMRRTVVIHNRGIPSNPFPKRAIPVVTFLTENLLVEFGRGPGGRNERTGTGLPKVKQFQRKRGFTIYKTSDIHKNTLVCTYVFYNSPAVFLKRTHGVAATFQIFQRTFSGHRHFFKFRFSIDFHIFPRFDC